MDIDRALQSALEYHQAGNLRQAEQSYRKILKKHPSNADALHLLGVLEHQSGRNDAAIKHIKKALEIDPNFPEAYNNLGNIYRGNGHQDAAISCYQKAIEYDPGFAPPYNNLGNIYLEKKQTDKAEKYFLKSLQCNPAFPEAYISLASIYQLKENPDKAMACYQKAITLNPHDYSLYHNLGKLFFKKGQAHTAIAHYRKAIELKPVEGILHFDMGLALEALKKRSDAMKAYETAVKYAPKFIPAQWLYCMSQLPVVYENQEEIRNCRNRYQEELITLRNKVFSGTKQDAAGLIRLVGSCPPFYLSYQGLNNRDLQHVYGEMVCHIMESGFPQWTRRPEMPPVSNGEKIRVGIVSGFFRLHSVWKIPVRGWIEHLDKNRFSLYGYYTGREKDAQTEFARKCFDHFTENIHDIHELIEIIRKDNLHLIIYPEIGMDPLTKNLAALRLAPVQCTSWGHPDTSGIPTIDYFLSSELMEPANGEDHYNEKLIRLPALSISYTPLEMPMDKGNREIFGLKSNSVLYFCAQSLYKYLPQYDDVFPRIAGQIDDCQFLFISSKNPGITEIMRTRVNNKFAEYGLDSKKHIVFLPFLDPVEYQMVNMFSDVFLDSIGWSGCNSTFEALACDLPVVTLPGKFMRGRHSYAILKMMNVHETIANSIDEYVDIAVKLGKDPQWRKHISDRMSENKHRVYRDTTCIRALEDFIEKAVWEEAHRPVEAD